jgi:hypothetical protein
MPCIYHDQFLGQSVTIKQYVLDRPTGELILPIRFCPWCGKRITTYNRFEKNRSGGRTNEAAPMVD